MCGLIGLATGPRTVRTEIFPSLIQRDSTRPYAVDDVPMAVAPQEPMLGVGSRPRFSLGLRQSRPRGWQCESEIRCRGAALDGRAEGSELIATGMANTSSERCDEGSLVALTVAKLEDTHQS